MHQPSPEQPKLKLNALGDFTAGAVFDFCAHLASRPSPLIVGKSYPIESLLEEFNLWARTRQMGDRTIDQKTFRAYADSGKLS